MNDWIKIPPQYENMRPIFVRYSHMVSLEPDTLSSVSPNACRLYTTGGNSGIAISMKIEDFIQYVDEELLRKNITSNVKRLLNEPADKRQI